MSHPYRLLAILGVAGLGAFAWTMTPGADPQPTDGARPLPAAASREAPTPWVPPPVRSFPDLPSSASPTLPVAIPSTASVVSAETLERYRHLGPPGPATEWLFGMDSDEDERRRQEDLEAREALRALPHMQAMHALASHVSRYRLSAEWARDMPLAEALRDRELELIGVAFDGELPVAYVREHACAWVGVADACTLPDYVSCVAADELDRIAQRLCEEPVANLQDLNFLPTPALFSTLSAADGP